MGRRTWILIDLLCGVIVLAVGGPAVAADDGAAKRPTASTKTVVDSVTLRSTARVAGDVPLTLFEVATLEGAAARFASTVVVEQPGSLDHDADGWRRVTVQMIREALYGATDAEGHRVNWGRLVLRGGSCRVWWDEPDDSSAADRNDSEDLGDVGVMINTDNAADVGATVRDHLVAVLRETLGVPAVSLRVGWRDADAGVLGTAIAGRVVAARVVGTGREMPISVTVYEGDRIVLRRTVRADVRVLRRVQLATRPLVRGAEIGGTCLTEETRWVEARVEPATRDAAVGGSPVRRIETGSVVEAGDIERPLAVRAGQPVTVHCITPTVVIKRPGRAREAAQAGDVARVELVGSGRVVRARIDGPGRAVVVAGNGP
ncbi:MAG: flagellar basal body P-ring formation chaperone FlgA [Planctomycetota bacterium]